MMGDKKPAQKPQMPDWQREGLEVLAAILVDTALSCESNAARESIVNALVKAWEAGHAYATR